MRNLYGRVAAYLRSFKLTRYLALHAVLGPLNFATAWLLYAWLGLGHHVAVAIGHFLQVGLGFFGERRAVFDRTDVTTATGGPKYICNELLSYLSLVLVMVVLVDWLKADPILTRVTIGTFVCTAVAYILNRNWTFGYSRNL